MAIKKSIMTVQGPKKAPVPFDSVRQEQFLAAYTRTGCIQSAADSVGISRRTVYDKRKCDPAFDERVAEAKERWLDTIRIPLVDRVVNGVEKLVVQKGRVVYHKGKPVVEKVYDNNVGLAFLKAHDPDFIDKREVTNKNLNLHLDFSPEALAALDLTSMSDEQLAVLERFAEATIASQQQSDPPMKDVTPVQALEDDDAQEQVAVT